MAQNSAGENTASASAAAAASAVMDPPPEGADGPPVFSPDELLINAELGSPTIEYSGISNHFVLSVVAGSDGSNDPEILVFPKIGTRSRIKQSSLIRKGARDAWVEALANNLQCKNDGQSDFLRLLRPLLGYKGDEDAKVLAENSIVLSGFMDSRGFWNQHAPGVCITFVPLDQSLSPSEIDLVRHESYALPLSKLIEGIAVFHEKMAEVKSDAFGDAKYFLSMWLQEPYFSVLSMTAKDKRPTETLGAALSMVVSDGFQKTRDASLAGIVADAKRVLPQLHYILHQRMMRALAFRSGSTDGFKKSVIKVKKIWAGSLNAFKGAFGGRHPDWVYRGLDNPSGVLLSGPTLDGIIECSGGAAEVATTLSDWFYVLGPQLTKTAGLELARLQTCFNRRLEKSGGACAFSLQQAWDLGMRPKHAAVIKVDVRHGLVALNRSGLTEDVSMCALRHMRSLENAIYQGNRGFVALYQPSYWTSNTLGVYLEEVDLLTAQNAGLVFHVQDFVGALEEASKSNFCLDSFSSGDDQFLYMKPSVIEALGDDNRKHVYADGRWVPVANIWPHDALPVFDVPAGHHKIENMSAILEKVVSDDQVAQCLGPAADDEAKAQNRRTYMQQALRLPHAALRINTNVAALANFYRVLKEGTDTWDTLRKALLPYGQKKGPPAVKSLKAALDY